MTSVTLKNVCKAYGDVLISKNVDLDIKEGEFVVFVGPSGCGKSTLLRCIAGLEDITSGDLYIGDQHMNDVEPSKRGVGMVFQSYALYPHLNLYDNMSFGLKLANADKGEIEKRVEHAAEILQLSHLLERQPKAYRVVSVSVLLLVVHLFLSQMFSYWMSLCLTLMPRCVFRCALKSLSFNANLAAP